MLHQSIQRDTNYGKNNTELSDKRPSFSAFLFPGRDVKISISEWASYKLCSSCWHVFHEHSCMRCLVCVTRHSMFVTILVSSGCQTKTPNPGQHKHSYGDGKPSQDTWFPVSIVGESSACRLRIVPFDFCPHQWREKEGGEEEAGLSDLPLTLVYFPFTKIDYFHGVCS